MQDRELAEIAWRKTKLSLERPYKDDNGQPISALLDITPDGQFINEPREDWDAKLGQRFRRIFEERGIDFFDHLHSDSNSNSNSNSGNKTVSSSINEAGAADSGAHVTEGGPGTEHAEAETKLMTPEMLFKMRSEILPRLHERSSAIGYHSVALGEMSHARDLLSLLLSSSTPAPLAAEASPPTSISLLASTSSNSSLAPGLLTASSVSALPQIPSVQTFNAQLVTGGKDDALRKASEVLRVAAESVERTTSRAEQYWADALRIRRANWGLITAPLPPGAPTGKGADKTSRDFLVSFGLEQSSPLFRRKAVAHISFLASDPSGAPLVFPHRDRTRLRVTLAKKNTDGLVSNSFIGTYPIESLGGLIHGAQKELVEQEIFEELIKEAGNLPTASARVSERLIVIDAAQDTELRFELIDDDLVESSNARLSSAPDASELALCDLIASALPVLLLRQHSYAKSTRLGLKTPSLNPVLFRTSTPQILQPIIDLLQYHVFLARVRRELERAVRNLRSVGVMVSMRFEGVGETGKEVVRVLEEGSGQVGGEAVLRIDGRHSIRFTFVSPSSFTVHLPQATMPIVSIPQLSQLLVDEIERSLLGRICEIGIEVCQSISGSWFVDEMMCRAVGRWEGSVLNFRIRCSDDLSIDCHAHQLLRSRSSPTAATSAPAPTLYTYGSRQEVTLGLFAWVKDIIEGALGNS